MRRRELVGRIAPLAMVNSTTPVIAVPLYLSNDPPPTDLGELSL